MPLEPYTVELTLRGSFVYANSPEDAVERARVNWLANSSSLLVVAVSARMDEKEG